MEQCHLSALADVEDTDVTWAQIDSRQYFEEKTGLPIASKNVKALHKRMSERAMWEAAIKKENDGLKERRT
jgi:hypothetical protein